MLHVRSGFWGRAGFLWGSVKNELVASDPGLLRLQLSLRGVLSVVLATTAAMIAGSLGHFSPVECAAGITLCMMGPFLSSQEPTRRQRQRTLVALLPAAIGATLLIALLHGHGPLGDSLFLVLVFACFLFAPWSPRGIGLGLVAIVTTYIGLYLELPVSTLPVQIAAQILAIPISAFACFVLVPVHPAKTLRRMVLAVLARAGQVLRHASDLAAADATPGDAKLGDAKPGDAKPGDAKPGDAKLGRDRKLRRDLVRLNQLALAVDDQVGLLDQATGEAIRSRLVDVELWTARLVDLLNNRQPTGSRRDAIRLGLHAQRIGRGRRYATQSQQFPRGTMVEALVGLGNAVHALSAATRPDAPVLPAPDRIFVPGPLAWRMAIRATTAAGLAMAGGMALSPQRWFWAVITVYVVFLNARTRGDTIYKGLQRLGGTLVGIVAGLVLATTLAGDTRVEIATLIVAVFGMYYFFLASYTTGIFFVTILLGILYGLLGASLQTVLVLRLEETAIGAAAAIVVALFVLPTRTRDQVQTSGRAVLTNLAKAVRATVLALGGTPGGQPFAAMAAMRTVDRSLADLQLALVPLVAGRSLLRRGAVERRASAVMECVHWTRMLAAESHALPPGTNRDDLVADAAAIADRLEMLAHGDWPAAERGASLRSDAGDPTGRAIHGLQQALVTVAERLEASTYSGFALRS